MIRKDEGDLLIVTDAGYGKRTKLKDFPRKGRAGKGVIAMKLTRVRGEIIGATIVQPGHEIFLISSDGVVIRQGVDGISRTIATTVVEHLHGRDDHDGDVEVLAGHRPQRLDRVHGRAVAVQAEHLAVGSRDGRADGEGQADLAQGDDRDFHVFPSKWG